MTMIEYWLTFGIIFGIGLSLVSLLLLVYAEWSLIEISAFLAFVLVTASFLWPILLLSLVLSVFIPRHDSHSFD